MNQIPESIEKTKFLMQLIVKGQHEDEVDILDCKMRFRALDEDESAEAQKEASGFDIISKVSIVRRSTLARAIVSISFADGGNWKPGSVSEASIFFGKLAPVLVEHIHRKYEAISKYRDMAIEQALGMDNNDKANLKN